MIRYFDPNEAELKFRGEIIIRNEKFLLFLYLNLSRSTMQSIFYRYIRMLNDILISHLIDF
jgi:hypothetical protein